jgi:hypothetical protein
VALRTRAHDAGDHKLTCGCLRTVVIAELQACFMGASRCNLHLLETIEGLAGQILLGSRVPGHKAPQHSTGIMNGTDVLSCTTALDGADIFGGAAILNGTDIHVGATIRHHANIWKVPLHTGAKDLYKRLGGFW